MTSKLLAFIKLLNGFSITVREFKDLIRTVAARNWHSLFEFILRKYDRSINLDYTKSYPEKKFLDEGRGAGILKPNRVLSSSADRIFEKIFFNDSPGLSRNLMFNEISTDRLTKNHIKYPEIKEIIKGDKLTIVLFEYLDLIRIPQGEEYKVLKATTFNMLDFLEEDLIGDDIHYDRFLIGKERLINSAVFSSDELLKLNAIVKSSPVYFQHFDLKEDNVFMDNVIIDWDNSGNYHLGADFGVLLLSYYVFKEHDFFKLYKDEISDYYKQVRNHISFDIFYLTVLFHFLNLYHGYSAGEAHYRKIQPVIDECKSKLRAIKPELY